jgi:hypothetical protein
MMVMNAAIKPHSLTIEDVGEKSIPSENNGMKGIATVKTKTIRQRIKKTTIDKVIVITIEMG